MSGPVASVLLPHVFTAREDELIAAMVLSICGVVNAWDDLNVVSTVGIGGTFRARNAHESRPFGLSASAVSEDELEAASALTRHFGVRPQSQIDVYAMCNGRVDHRILGEIALYLVTAIPRALVSFGGDLSEYASAGGRLMCEYETAWGTVARASYGDAEFLRAWLLHPSFS